jgi:large subunit ribosomal protein L10
MLLSVDDVKALANLPSKEALRAQLAGTVAAPLSGFVNVLNANLRGFLNILDARAKQI